MPKRAAPLTDRKLKSLKPEDKPVTDGAVAGLTFTPSPTGGVWSLRYLSPVLKNKKGDPARREAGIGPFQTVGLADARERALAMRKLIEAGEDPLEERRREKRAAEADAGMPSFGQAAQRVHAELKKGWKNTKNVERWLTSVQTYLAAIAGRRVDTLKAADFADALRTEWTAHPRAAADVLQRAGVIMQWCEAHEYIEYDPTLRVRKLLAKQTSSTVHHPAMPWRIAPAFVREHLADIKPTEVARACLFVQMHTACRPNEARGMRWGELDLDAAVWVVPPTRMKGKIAHRVPLAPDVVALLRRMSAAKLHEDMVFPNMYRTGPITDYPINKFLQKTKAQSDTPGRTATAHGNRSMFKDWSIDNGHDERTAERQLAHKPKGQVAQAYERSTQFERRAHLMVQWADYLHGRAVTNVIPLSNAAA